MDWIIRSLAAEGISVVEEDVTAALGRNSSRSSLAWPEHQHRKVESSRSDPTSLKAERRTGELLQGMEKHPGRLKRGKAPRSPEDDHGVKLADLGISKNESSTWQKLAKAGA